MSAVRKNNVRFPRTSVKRGIPKQQKLVTLQQVKSLISHNIEPRFYDVSQFAQNTSSTGNQYGLSQIPQGVADGTRGGDEINLLSLEVRFECYLQGTGGTNDFTNCVRILIYQWLPMSTAAIPVPANVVQLTPGATGQSSIMTMYNWDARSQYKILADKTFNLSGNGPSDAFWVFKHKFNNTVAAWQAASTTIQQNGIFAWVVSDSLVATHPLTNLQTRVIFTDA